MRWLFAILVLAVVVPGAYSAATIANIYAAPSEAERYSSGVGTACQAMSASCDDSEYSSVSDVYTALGDGSTSASSGSTIRNSTNTQSAFNKLVFHTDGLVATGNYSLRIGHSAGTSSYRGLVCRYVNDSAVNVSSCVEYTYPGGSSNWYEVDIDTLVRRSFGTFDGAIKLRNYNLDSTSIAVVETYLKRPFSQGDFSLVATGVSEADINTVVENSWLVVSQLEASIDGVSCELHRLNDINDTFNETEIVGVPFEYVYRPDSFAVYWPANESLGVLEGHNYEVECGVTVNGVVFSETTQYVYINNQRSILESIQAFVVYIAQILGFLSNADQGGVASVEVFDGDYYAGQGASLVAKVTYSGEPVSNTSCNASIYYPNVTAYAVNQSMSYETNGMFKYDVSVPWVEGVYPTEVYCVGGLFTQKVYGSGSWNVLDGVRMQSIT